MSEGQQPVHYGLRPMELWISRILLGGVVLSGTVILAGLLTFLVKGSADNLSLKDLVDQQHMAPDFGAIIRGIGSADGESLIQVGLLILILTPIVRVAMSLFFFARERDRIYVAITATVLLILLSGLIGAALIQ